jgi:amino acid transporter/tetratricopeptide (TPR) repeat protein
VSEADLPGPSHIQNVEAVSGFAYGVMGADLHVFGDGVPVYLLTLWRDAPEPDAQWLQELPSRMLNARFAIVGFTGREEDLAQLRQWANDGPRLAVRWLHAPGGQGKTRLAAKFAAEAAATGWKVVTAVHGPGTVIPPPGSQDLRLGDATGVLIIVDYADRWPLTHLTWLFSNALLHQVDVKARVLLIARSADAWPAVRAALADHQAGTTTHFLQALPDEPERAEMFVAARDSFATRYDVEVPDRIEPPGPLDAPEMSLILAVHMAALVAVDAHVHGLRPPQGMAGLTIYLLDREHQHWARRYGDRTHELNPADWIYRTPPAVMNRVVFTAALTGSVSRPTGTEILQGLQLEPGPDQVLTDHGICYPAASPSWPTVLEPLYPDRLAEDFLALTLPGHSADYPAQSWASVTATSLVSRRSDGTPAAHLARPLTVLASAAGPGRWPHVAAQLNTLLISDPALAIDAGSPALTALTEAVDINVLEAIEPLLPARRHIDLDVGAAAIVSRLTRHRLSRIADTAERAGLLEELARRLGNAGRYQEALEASGEAVNIYRQLAHVNKAQHLPALATSLYRLSRALAELGRLQDALAACDEAVAVYRGSTKADRGAWMPDLAATLVIRSTILHGLRRLHEAVEPAEEAVAIRRKLAKADPAAYLPDLAEALSTLGVRQRVLSLVPKGDVSLSERAARRRHADSAEKALAAHKEAERIRRILAEAEPCSYLPELAESLNNIGVALQELGRSTESFPPVREAVVIRRRLAELNPAVYPANLAHSLANLGGQTLALGQTAEALALYEEALQINREVARANPARYSRELVNSLLGCRTCLTKLGRTSEALTLAEEAVAVSREIAEADPSGSLSLLVVSLSALGREDAQAEAAQETASIYRRLAETEPDAYLPGLGQSLTVICIEAMKRRDLAALLYPAGEAVSVYRRLATAEPDEYTSELARVLSMHARALAYYDERAEALAEAHEALALLRKLVHKKGQPRDTRRILKIQLRETRTLWVYLQPSTIAATEARLSGRSAFLAAARADGRAYAAGNGRDDGSAAEPNKSFAVAFWAMSIMTGIFITFGFALTTGGPRSIWTWPIVVAGQALVFMVYSALAARVPLSGFSYGWASRLANVHLGWWLGWMSFAFLTILAVSVDYGVVQVAFQPLIGETYTPASAALETLVVLAIQALLIIWSTRVIARMNTTAVAAEIVASLGLTALLIVVAAIRGIGHWSNLTSAGIVPSVGYYAWLGPFMLATLFGAYTIVKLDAVSNLPGETPAQPRVLPTKAWGSGELITGAFGMAFLIALDYAISNIPAASKSSAPVAFIVSDVLGGVVQKLFLIFVCVSIFGYGLNIMMTNSRLVWSMSRDLRLPGYQLWRQVPRATGGPSWATTLTAVIGVAITLVLRTHTSALVTLFTASMIMPALLCASMVLLYVFVGRRRRVPAGFFSLGRWEIPVVAGALVWLAYELIILTGSSAFRDAQYYTLGALGLGLVFYLGQWLLKPAAMRIEAHAHGAEPFEVAGQPGPSPAPGTASGGGVS